MKSEEYRSYETIVRLIVSSVTRTSEQLSQCLSVVPDDSWDIGDFRVVGTHVTPIKEEENAIVIHSGIDSDVIAEHMNILLSRFRNKMDTLSEISNEEDGEVILSVVIYSKREPDLLFDRETIKFLFDVNGELDIDLYVLGEIEDDRKQTLSDVKVRKSDG